MSSVLSAPYCVILAGSRAGMVHPSVPVHNCLCCIHSVHREEAGD